MTRLFLTCAIAAAAIGTPAHAQKQPDTIERGTYVCELPGNAAGSAGIAQPDESFSIESASRYVSAQGSGIYLRRGDRMTMTSGPRNGDSYVIVSRGFLRKLVDGAPSRLRCVRRAR
ncbi:elongation factor P [Aurantiacibacter rhizosphaerae]|uniref:Elongation factor P n=1 Tax=Aurantiacibacter rhizosphaerae TaxID=2691582 RepID=A0A844XEH4_9SPHN|nr:elongation factor P [Aurantiacibacter rhizosphaerae]MWV28159.1 elongation factor P [Aurantiacibacter rhizosphaerae]